MDSNKTLPASWYCSKNLLDLERRAVFLKSWYLLGPIVKFCEDKDVEYEFSGVTLAVRKLPDGSVTVTDTADSTPLPHHLTKTGLLFAALTTSAPPFTTFYPPTLIPLLDQYDFTRLPHRRSLSYTGRFNWKTMVDGYQECLHCQYTHRTFAQLYPPHSYVVRNHATYSRHFIADPADAARSGTDDGLFLFFFPACTLNLYSGGMSAFRVCPTTDPGVTRMEFDYFHESEAGSEAFERYFRFVRRVAAEDFELCEGAQGNLARGVYSQGVLNVRRRPGRMGGEGDGEAGTEWEGEEEEEVLGGKENGVSHYQGLVRDMVVKAFREEEAERETAEMERTGGDAAAQRCDAWEATTGETHGYAQPVGA